MTKPFNLQDDGITVAEIHRNLPPSALYEHAIRYEKDAGIGENGALVPTPEAKPAARRRTSGWSNILTPKRMHGGARSICRSNRSPSPSTANPPATISISATGSTASTARPLQG
jgi:hypothetical protein